MLRQWQARRHCVGQVPRRRLVVPQGHVRQFVGGERQGWSSSHGRGRLLRRRNGHGCNRASQLASSLRHSCLREIRHIVPLALRGHAIRASDSSTCDRCWYSLRGPSPVHQHNQSCGPRGRHWGRCGADVLRPPHPEGLQPIRRGRRWYGSRHLAIGQAAWGGWYERGPPPVVA